MREGDNGERLQEIRSIPLLIPTLTEKQVSVRYQEEEGKEHEEPVCVGTQAEGELQAYIWRKYEHINIAACAIKSHVPTCLDY